MGRRRVLENPAVVLDWNVLQKMPADGDVLSHYQCIVPDQAFHEIAKKPLEEGKPLIRKFGRWASRNVDRLWVGRTPEDLFEKQLKADGRRLGAGDVVHPQFTRGLRAVASDPNYDWGASLSDVRTGEHVENRKQQIEKLVRLCSAIAELWKEQPKRVPRQEEVGGWLREAHRVTDLVETFFGKVWRPEWRQQVASDPNRFAVIRWARFVAWSCVKRAAGQTVKYENNFDDAHYALLGSFTGHLGTDDRKLGEAAMSIFPGICVLELAALMDNCGHSKVNP